LFCQPQVRQHPDNKPSTKGRYDKGLLAFICSFCLLCKLAFLGWIRVLESNCMNYFEAMKILDRVREGQNYPEHVITMALKLTGDIQDD